MLTGEGRIQLAGRGYQVKKGGKLPVPGVTGRALFSGHLPDYPDHFFRVDGLGQEIIHADVI